MDSRRHLCHVRWPCVGGVGCGVARLRRIVPLSSRNLRPESARASGFIFIYLATFIQRAAFDCLRVDWACRICFVLLASASKSIRIPRLEPRASAAREFAITMADFRSDICGGLYFVGCQASFFSQKLKPPVGI